MPLSFLAPLFLAGLAALAIPIVIHLRRRHERKEVEFPSLMFLHDIPFRSERRSRLRHRFLLAVRVLALALLAVAFARPLLEGDGTASAGVVGPREVVVLVDRSWSMRYGSRWEEAAGAVREEVASLGPQDRVTLVLFDEGATAPVRSSPDRDRVLRLVDAARPGDRATRVEPALRLARSVLETSRLPRREVVLVSDFQESIWSGESTVSLPRGVAFRPVIAGEEEEEWSNVSVASVDLRRTDDARGRGTIVPTARLVRRGDGDAIDSVVAVLEIDGRERERVDVILDDRAVEVRFGPVPLTDEPMRATVRIDDDGLPPDDARHFVLSPGRRISVLVLEPPGARSNTSLYLARGLELSREPPMRVDVSSAGAPSDLRQRYDVVVLNDRGARGLEEELERFVTAGGGILWAPGAGEDAAAQPLEGLTAAAGEIRDHPRGEELRLGSLDRDHPIFEPFRDLGTGNFTATRFFRTRRLAPTDSARVIARFDDGSPALLEGRAGEGRLLVWASTLHTFWTDLPLQPVFVPFLNQAVLHLADRSEEVPSYRVGSVLSLPEAGNGAVGAGGGSGSRWSAVLTPGGDREEMDDRTEPLTLREAGFYELLEPGEERAGTPVAVNVDPREGDLTRRDVEELAAAVAPPVAETDEDVTGQDPAPSGVRREDRERHQGLWRFLLAAAFVLLVGETALSNRLSRTGT